MLTVEEQAILGKLEAWAARADTIMNLFGTERTLTGAAASHAKTAYSAFKDQLRDESLAQEKRIAQGALTVAERQWYQPTIYEAANHLRASKNANAGQEMYSSVYDAHTDFTHMIASMRGFDKLTTSDDAGGVH